MGAVTATEIRPGLWRWLARHPEWHATDEQGEPTLWPPQVGCVLHESDAGVVFIDPLIPDADADAFWRWADERCDGRPVSTLETIVYHRRSREQVIARYGASAQPPASVQAHQLPEFSETVYWIAEHRALIPGDVLVGAGTGELVMCPQSWLEDVSATPTHAALRNALRPLLELAPELVLVSHGEPVLRDGAAALAHALRAA